MASSNQQTEIVLAPMPISGQVTSMAEADLTIAPTQVVETSTDISANVSKTRAITVIVTLVGISFLNTMGSGILIAATPQIARDVGLSQALVLWSAAVYALVAGRLLLIFGAMADVVGAKPMWITGCFLFCVFTMTLGFAKTSLQIILFRPLLAIAIAMCLPTAVGLIAHTFLQGPWRNTAFAMNGMGQPLGYALGLVLGGIFTDTIGWRWAYYMMAIINFCLSTASIWSLPNPRHHTEKKWTRRLAEIDRVDAIVLGTALGLSMYVFAMTTSSYLSICYAQSATLLAVSLVLLITFPCWMHQQTKKGGPALIPNSLLEQRLLHGGLYLGFLVLGISQVKPSISSTPSGLP
ncbi:putative Major facilitator superfamily transporter [Seiridium cardinale]